MGNIYQKLQKCRVELQNLKLKKSGHNSYSKYEYFELNDFMPSVNLLFEKHCLFSNFSIFDKEAKLTIYDTAAENLAEMNTITFTSPVEELDLKGCNKIQALGGIHTYLKRYLYMNALEIVENDMFDPLTGKDTKKVPKQETTQTTNEDDDLYAYIDEIDDMETLSAYYKTAAEKVKDIRAFNTAVSKRKLLLSKQKGVKN